MQSLRILRILNHQQYNFCRRVQMFSTDHKSPSELSGYGVFSDNADDDISTLVENYTAPALAKALRDREDILHICAQLINNNDIDLLRQTLRPFLKSNVDKRRNKKTPIFNVSGCFTKETLTVIQRQLHRIPRQVFHTTGKRASVVIPLCDVDGVASILFERRSGLVRTHKHEVCFPGGMVDENVDTNILQTSLREMEEELGIPPDIADVLGIMRCNWSEVAKLTGVAVTPVVAYLGDLGRIYVNPNFDEVEEYFTVPVYKLLDESLWTLKEFSAPSFHGGRHPIWGLTGYLLHRFLTDTVKHCKIEFVEQVKSTSTFT